MAMGVNQNEGPEKSNGFQSYLTMSKHTWQISFTIITRKSKKREPTGLLMFFRLKRFITCRLSKVVNIGLQRNTPVSTCNIG